MSARPLNHEEHTLAEVTLSALVGLALTDMWRYAGCQKFEFGEQRPFINRKGQQATASDISLVVSTAWQITGPQDFSLTSDHFAGDVRTDDHASDFYDSLSHSPPTVTQVQVSANGSLTLTFSGGGVLCIPASENSDDIETWRFMDERPGVGRHLVLEPMELYHSSQNA